MHKPAPRSGFGGLPRKSWLDIMMKRAVEDGGEPWPPEVAAYVETGGVDLRVRDAREAAAAQARLECLDDLMRLRDELPDDAGLMVSAYLEGEIGRLRRRMTPTPERKRQQTRERVRQYRKRKREGHPT